MELHYPLILDGSTGTQLQKRGYDGGGSVSYKALVYEVTKIHQFASEVDGLKPYVDGFEIKILGMTVYREIYE